MKYNRYLLILVFLLLMSTNIFSVAFPVDLFAGGLSDSNGDPYVGYKVYAYYSGTSVELTIYTSRDQSVPIVQPVVLDARGAYEFFAYGIYDFVLRNPDDDTTILTFAERDFTKLAENVFGLEDGSGNTTVSFTGPDGLNYVNSGYLGVGMTVPVTAIHINKPSPAIRLYDSTETKDIDIKYSGGLFEVKVVSGGDPVETLIGVYSGQDQPAVGVLAPWVGEIRMGARNGAPDYWLTCEGTAISRTTYAALFAVTGTSYGAGDGATTFNIPDFRAKYARGKDGSFALGATCNQLTKLPTSAFTATAAATSHTHANTFAIGTTGSAHTHTMTLQSLWWGTGWNTGAQGWAGGTEVYNGNKTNTTNSGEGTHTHNITGSVTPEALHTHSVGSWGGGDAETRPNSVVVNYYIYTGIKY